jgi:hypothetical protein
LITSPAPIERATREPSATRVYSSTTLRIRIVDNCATMELQSLDSIWVRAQGQATVLVPDESISMDCGGGWVNGRRWRRIHLA